MKLFLEHIWATITQILNIASLSPVSGNGITEVPLFQPSHPVIDTLPRGPRFRPPGRAIDGPGAEFQCDYPSMVGWRFCSAPGDRGCWLTDDNGNTFDITTDYEKIAPVGVLREYTLEITDSWINADGLNFTDAKVFNSTYPGPWIQACWGDTVQVTVINKLTYNGTSIHWHGIRQNQTMHMDGVNGITQCPVAPNESFVYKWNATQYGSTWYHSHYSMQYADGLVGPLVSASVMANFDAD